MIDDLSGRFPLTPRGTRWGVVTDRVMGGLSDGLITRDEWTGRPCLHLTGAVSLANGGGFLQAAIDLVVDASRWAGVEITLAGPPEEYHLHLRTTDLTRPQQSYRAAVRCGADWRSQRLSWEEFAPHRTDVPFNPARLRRLGVVAIGRAFRADLCVADLRFYGVGGGA